MPAAAGSGDVDRRERYGGASVTPREAQHAARRGRSGGTPHRQSGACGTASLAYPAKELNAAISACFIDLSPHSTNLSSIDLRKPPRLKVCMTNKA